MKNLSNLVSEKLSINKDLNNGSFENSIIVVSSKKCDMKIPKKNIEEFAKIIEKKFNNVDIEKRFQISIDCKDIKKFTVPCKIKEKDPSYREDHYPYYIEQGFYHMKKIDPEHNYVTIINCDMINDFNDYNPSKELDLGWCGISDDDRLNAYWLQDISYGRHINVEYDFKQIAFAIIMDRSYMYGIEDNIKKDAEHQEKQGKEYVQKINAYVNKIQTRSGKRIFLKSLFTELYDDLLTRYYKTSDIKKWLYDDD